MTAMDGDLRPVRWSELISRAGLAPRSAAPSDPLINAVIEDSRQARPGAIFVAVRGTKADGHAFVEAAVRGGVSGVITEREVSVPASLPVLRLSSTRGVACRLATALYGLDELQRAGRLKLVGITGTNGKSTFCYMMRSILSAAGRRPAMFGTIEYDLISRKIEASMTTPPAIALVGYLAEAARAGATHAVMEVSSHALDQGRVEGLDFSVGVFSNLTGDHLDYHATMAEYLKAKKRLFDGLGPDAVAVINTDDPAGESMIADCRAKVRRYSLEPDRGDVCGVIREMTASGVTFELLVRHEVIVPSIESLDRVQVDLPLVGRHNVQNALAAIEAALALGIPLTDIVQGLNELHCVPGRLQRVPASASAGFSVLVDYAHTDDALRNVLTALRGLPHERLIVLFGCGGERDRTKRPRMAAVAGEMADSIVVTSDNPRSEDAATIIHDVLSGFQQEQMARVRVEADRRDAIATALGMARPGDIVLLAGKGHENYQIVGNEKLPFDDAAVAAEILAGRPGIRESR